MAAQAGEEYQSDVEFPTTDRFHDNLGVHCFRLAVKADNQLRFELLDFNDRLVFGQFRQGMDGTDIDQLFYLGPDTLLDNVLRAKDVHFINPFLVIPGGGDNAGAVNDNDLRTIRDSKKLLQITGV